MIISNCFCTSAEICWSRTLVVYVTVWSSMWSKSWHSYPRHHVSPQCAYNPPWFCLQVKFNKTKNALQQAHHKHPGGPLGCQIKPKSAIKTPVRARQFIFSKLKSHWLNKNCIKTQEVLNYVISLFFFLHTSDLGQKHRFVLQQEIPTSVTDSHNSCVKLNVCWLAHVAFSVRSHGEWCKLAFLPANDDQAPKLPGV